MSSSCIKNPLAQRLCPACQKPSTLRVPPSSPCSSDFNQLQGGKCMLLIVIASYCIIVPCDRSDRWCKSYFFLVVRVRMSCEAKFGKAAHPSSGRSGDRPPGASWFNLRQSFDLCSSHVTLHMICFFFNFYRMLYMMPLMQSAKPFAICRANCLVRCNLVMYLYSNS